jgi:hypothetical protein
MREFAEPLKRRIYRAKWIADRYRNDPDFRLSEINRKRAYYGRPLCSSLDEVRGRI